MAAGILGTSVSGLLAAQRSLSVASHNIANVNNEDYSRQRVDLVTREPQPFGSGYIGTGVTVDSIRRVYDEFATMQVRTGTSNFNQAEEFHSLAAQVDDLLADPNAGLMPALQGFFNALQDVSDDPSSAPARQVALSEAESLSDRFQYLDQRINELRFDIDGSLQNSVAEVNGITSAIAEVNRQMLISGSAGGDSANDLLDRRDALIRQLSEKVSVTVVEQDDGTANVFVGNGQAVVAGVESRDLTLTQNSFDPERIEIAYVTGSGNVTITDQLSGGEIGGAVTFRNQVLDEVQNRLGQLAVGIVDTFNAQHRLGLDLNGNPGGDFFEIGGPDVIDRSGNSGTASVTAAIQNAGALTTSDYRLDYDGANYTLTRQSDGQITNLNALGFPGSAVTVDGLQVDIASGAMNAGDSFLIRPTRGLASEIGLTIGDPAQLAAAAPVRTAATAGNTGSGKISQGSVTDVSAFPLSAGNGDVTLTYLDDTGGGSPGFVVSDSSGTVGTLAYDPSTESAGKQLTLPAPYGGISLTVSGVPADSDTFTVTDNTNGVGDNRNALSLAGLQSRLTLNNGTTSYEDAYGLLVSDVGIETRQAEINRDAQEVLMNRAIDRRAAVSGVNLDEEAADILRFQQAYQASARLIGTADLMFQTLITAVGR